MKKNKKNIILVFLVGLIFCISVVSFVYKAQAQAVTSADITDTNTVKTGTEAETSTTGGNVSTSADKATDSSTGSTDLLTAANNKVRNAINGALYKAASVIGDAALKVVIAVLDLLAQFCAELSKYAGWALDQTLTPGLYNFTNSTMITSGWATVRDVCNLFFLIVLLFIAFCTILKIEKYHAKKTLLMLIIMALLINFSKPITVFIFDGSQLMMTFFLNKMAPSGGQTASVKLLSDIPDLIYKNLQSAIGGLTDSHKIAIYYLFVIVFLFMFAVALFVTAIFLLIRIVAVILLIIVSPLAFLASAIPDFQGLSSAWWKALFNYCYYGPAAAFFLYLAVKFSLSTPGNLLPTQTISGQDTVIKNILQYLVVLVFLYASIIMSKQFGVFAANAITGRANKLMAWAGKGAAMAPYRAAAGLSRATGVSGAVSQKLQQSRLGRLLTKEGRAEAQEEQEAKMAERFGVKGAKERQVRKRAKKLKDEGYSEAALKSMAAKGDEAAAYRLAEDGNMDDATYSSIMPKIKDPKLKKLLEDKTKEKTADVYINHKARSEARERVTAAMLPMTAANIANAEKQIAGEEYNKMNTDDWKKQKNKKDIFDPAYAYRSEAVNGFNNLHDDAKKDIGKNASGVDYATMTGAGCIIP